MTISIGIPLGTDQGIPYLYTTHFKVKSTTTVPSEHSEASLPEAAEIHNDPTLTEATSLEPLSAIHPHLLDILRSTTPTLLMRVSRSLYDSLIESLYTRLELDGTNVRGVMLGSERRRKRDALAHVKDLTLDLAALEVLGELAPTSMPDDHRPAETRGEGRTLSSASSLQPETAYGPQETVRPTSSSTPIVPLFPKINNLRLPWSLISSLSETFDSSSESQTAIHLMHRHARTLRDHFRPSVIHLGLQAEDPSKYWALDNANSTLLGPLLPSSAEGEPGQREGVAVEQDSEGRDQGEREHNQMTRSTDGNKAKNGQGSRERKGQQTTLVIRTTLPPQYPARGYIPHDLLVPSNVYFTQPQRTFRHSPNVDVSQLDPEGAIELGSDIGSNMIQTSPAIHPLGTSSPPATEDISAITLTAAPASVPTAKQYAKVIRDHYDVHASRDTYPDIRYHVPDVGGVREELVEMRGLRVRVDMRLLDESSGVLVQMDS